MARPTQPKGQTEPATIAPRSDGRRAWRERNRLAVVDALLDLYAEGKIRPGAQELADRAGLSRRSVFRYFDDLDDLDRTAIARQQERVRHLVELPGIGEGPLEDRIGRLAAHRVALFSAIAPAARVSRARAAFQAVIGEELAQSRRLFARQIERHFAFELSGMTDDQRAKTAGAADVASSFETYDLLRQAHHMADDEIEATMVVLMRGIFGSP